MKLVRAANDYLHNLPGSCETRNCYYFADRINERDEIAARLREYYSIKIIRLPLVEIDQTFQLDLSMRLNQFVALGTNQVG